MFSTTISVTDGTTPRTFTKVSQDGMDSKRREDTAGVLTAENSSLTIKHTMDEKAKTKPNRHLVSITKTQQDANEVDRVATVHVVITRDKLHTDAGVEELAADLADFLGTPANVALLINGGN